MSSNGVKADGSDCGTLSVSLEESRYDRQERVSWWSQSLLSSAKVVVVGAGALGNEVVKNLALIGIGNILVLDTDTIESSNLARCVFFRPGDEGQPKASVLARRARDLNPDIRIDGIVSDIRSFGTGLAVRADVLVGALDNREARLYCNRLAARTGSAWIDGAIEALTGVARVFTPPEPCYECTLSDTDWEILAHRQSCRLLSRDDLLEGKVPTTATTSSVVAGVQAQEVVKLLHGAREGVRPLSGAMFFDGANNDAYPLAYSYNPECMAHHRFNPCATLEPGNDGFCSVTAEQVARKAWPEMQGSEQVPELLTVDFADDHVVGWNCTHCDQHEDDHRPAVLITWGDATCPTCKSVRQPEFLTSLDVPGPFSGRTMTDLGVRHDEILAVRRGSDERFVWLRMVDPRLPKGWDDAKATAGA